MNELTKTLTRLVNKLLKRDEYITQLENRLAVFDKETEEKKYTEEWRWRHIREFTPKENLKLPIPRLEIRWERLGRYTRIANYFLVYRHLTGEITAIPLGSTRTDGGKDPDGPMELRTPFRDGAHMNHDMKHLNLRAFVVADGKYQEIKLREE